MVGARLAFLSEKAGQMGLPLRVFRATVEKLVEDAFQGPAKKRLLADPNLKPMRAGGSAG